MYVDNNNNNNNNYIDWLSQCCSSTPATSNHVIQQQKTKKKCHGNRQLQRYRKKFHTQAITTSMINTMNQKSTPTTNENYNCFDMQMMTAAHLFQKDLNVYMINYSMMDDQTFKDRLSTANDQNDIVTLMIYSLYTTEKLNFARQLTQLLYKLFYLKLQQDHWAYYYHMGMTEGVWAGQISIKMANDNTLCRKYGRTKKFIEDYQKILEQQFTQTTNEFNEHQEHIKQWKQEKNTYSMDLNRLLAVMIILINKDQYQFRTELEQKMTLFKFNVDDHRYVKAFYDLQPNQQQMTSTKIIWHATYNEQNIRTDIAILNKWLLTKRPLSSSINTVDHSLNRIKTIMADIIICHDETLHSSDCNKTSQEIKHNWIHQAISIAETNAQKYGQIIKNEKIKIVNKDNIDLIRASPSRFSHMLKIIEMRQNHMLTHAQYKTQQILTNLSL